MKSSAAQVLKTKVSRSITYPLNLCGFTLIEIMVVVVLIGLLSAVALPNFIRSRTTAQTDVCINNLRAIEYAIQQWALEANKDASTAVEFSDISPYLKRTTLCPAGGTSFANSYSVSLVSEQPVCQKVPSTHLLPGPEVLSANANPGDGGSAPTGPSGGTGTDPGGSSGHGNGGGSGSGGGKGHKGHP